MTTITKGGRDGTVVRVLLAASACVGIVAGAAPRSSGKGDYSDLKPIPVVVELGDKDNHVVFKPDRLQFETGKLYKLLLVNDSPQKHEFASADLAAAVFTVKAEVVSPQGEEIAEFDGVIREIEVGPGTTVEWYFVALRTVKEGAFLCDQPGHLAAGMKGTFRID
jgi:uncharacterized cupredoxin-like copper-binding protein